MQSTFNAWSHPQDADVAPGVDTLSVHGAVFTWPGSASVAGDVSNKEATDDPTPGGYDRYSFFGC